MPTVSHCLPFQPTRKHLVVGHFTVSFIYCSVQACMRHAPSNALLCFETVIARVATESLSLPLFQVECSEVSYADSPSSNPVFALRQEYRTGPESVSRIPHIRVALCRVLTISIFRPTPLSGCYNLVQTA